MLFPRRHYLRRYLNQLLLLPKRRRHRLPLPNRFVHFHHYYPVKAMCLAYSLYRQERNLAKCINKTHHRQTLRFGLR
jgi:hypothetical protein